jgi:hypothetical protein
MIRRCLLLAGFLFGSACAGGGDSSKPHDPQLRLGELARGTDTDDRLFTRYDPNGPCSWNQGWPWKLDLSGVGWDQTTTVTALTPRHVVMANHYKRPVGGRAVFHDRKGRNFERHIVKIISFKESGPAADIAVGLLDRPLPASVRTYPVPQPRKNYNEFLTGAPVLVTEQSRGLFFHQIAGVYENAIRFRFDEHIDKSHRKNLIKGDSGNPSFLLSGGELVLIETHTSGGAGAGPFYGSPEVVATLRDIMKTLDPSYTLKTAAIDKRVLEEACDGRAAMPKPTPAPPPRPAPQATVPNPQANTPRQPRPRVIVPPPQ